MPSADELYPPAQYGWGWLLLALGILVVLILSAWLLTALTRPRQLAAEPPEDGLLLFTDVLTMLREEYLLRVDDIERAYREGRVDARGANLEFSKTVRAFVNEYSGLEAPVLALDDLVARGVHPALIDAMSRHYYPSIFRRGPVIDPTAGAEAARTVVRSWH